MELLEQIAELFDAGTLKNVGGSKVLFERSISGKYFQIKRTDYRTRFRWGARAVSFVRMLGPLFDEKKALSAVREEYGDSRTITDPLEKAKAEAAMMQAAQKMLPVLGGLLDDEQLLTFIETLVVHAKVKMRENGMKSIEEDIAAEYAFGDDLLLMIPLAMTVLEVNLSDGFFKQIRDVFGSLSSQKENSESSSDESSQTKTNESESSSLQT